MNKGLKIAAGHYVLFLNAGDQLHSPETLSHIENRTKNSDLIFGDALEQSPNGAAFYKPAKKPQTIGTGLFTHHQAIFYKTEIAQKVSYNITYSIAADYDFTLTFLKLCSTHHHIKKPICIFEQGGISQTKAKQARKEQFKIRKAHKICTPVGNALIYMMQTITWNLRQAFPSLYWLVKSGGNTANGS